MTHRTGPPPPQPDDLLHRIASEEALWTAWDEVRLARGAPGVDGVSVRDFDREAPAAIARLARELVARRYRPRPLRRVWVRKRGKENEFRALAIPVVRDRVAAGAAHAVLEHRFEPLFHDSSFGFRRGRGTLAALRRVLRLRDEGFGWVARGDVDEFFDRVDQHRLFQALEPVIPWEVRRLLVLWTRTRVWDGADRARVLRGVPQGTATSPLLANFYLTSFDRQLDDDGVHAVRYVDDLAALARTEHEARAALNTMEGALQPLGLALNPARDPVRHFDQGFEFLGFELRGRLLRVAPSKLLEFRRHAVECWKLPAPVPCGAGLPCSTEWFAAGARTTAWESPASSFASSTRGSRNGCARRRCGSGHATARAAATWSWPGSSRWRVPGAASSSPSRLRRSKATATASPWRVPTRAPTWPWRARVTR
jgi:CRISPR-associated protein Cas1